MKKHILVCVTGAIAIYKTLTLIRILLKNNYDVDVIATKNALKFINPITFETLTKKKIYYDTFDREFNYDVEHIELAKKTDLVLVAPASANIIGKLANGICDDMLTTTVFACNKKKLIVPSMNDNMYLNKILQDNLEKLKKYGYSIMQPVIGMLACNTYGIGKMPEPIEIFEVLEYTLLKNEKLINKKVLITAGPTIEDMDPVRFISNNSSGKMGFSLAKACSYFFSKTTLLSQKDLGLKVPYNVDNINFRSTDDLLNTVLKLKDNYDIIIMAAAVSDYKVLNYSNNKIKKSDDDLILKLIKNPDILSELSKNKTNYLVGFCMETNNLIENAKLKLQKKNIDLIIANELTSKTGFKHDTNEVYVINKKLEVNKINLNSKDNIAFDIVKNIIMEGNFNE